MLRTGLLRGSSRIPALRCAGMSAVGGPLLGDKHLQHFIAARNIKASLVHQPPLAPQCQVVKTMVLMLKDASSPQASATSTETDGDHQCAEPAAEAAVVVLLSGDRKVDARAVASHLGVPRKRLRLAAREEAAAVTGFAVGCIPPFGHQASLRTLLDVHMLQQAAQQMFAGGGSPNIQLLTTAHDLLSATAAETGPFTLPAAAAAGQPAAASSQLDAAIANPAGLPARPDQQGQHVRQMPLPWPRGSEEVQLVGVIAQRRRIAKLLLFCSLVPDSVPQLPADGTAAYLRRLWQHPDEPGMACEVQIICGKTIERAMGREAAAALFDSVRVGSVVAVTGRVQPNPTGKSSGPVLDVVAHKLEILHKNRDALSRALRAAQRHSPVTTAAGLCDLQQQLHLQQQQLPEEEQPAAAAPGAADSHFSSQGRKQPQQQPTAKKAATVSAAAAPDEQQESQVQCWQLPLPDECVHWVCDLAAIAQMQQAVLPQQPGAAAAAGSVAEHVIGIDCEWRPYSRGQPATPVALLQLSTRSEVFLVDLLAICEPCEQSEAEQALGNFLLELLTSPHVTKLGFQLSSDLSRLQESYPQLACFQAAAIAAAGISRPSPKLGAPLVGHIDLLTLSRLAAPSLAKVGVGNRISLSKLVLLLLGAPLDKTQQTSDWAARPLSAAQQQYAAADSHVLTVLFDELLRRLPATATSIYALLDRLASQPQWLPLTPEPEDEDKEGRQRRMTQRC